MDYELTWKQFKDAVEAQGVTDDAKVSYIDTSGQYEPSVMIHNDGSFRIWSGASRDPIDKGDDEPEVD